MIVEKRFLYSFKTTSPSFDRFVRSVTSRINTRSIDEDCMHDCWKTLPIELWLIIRKEFLYITKKSHDIHYPTYRVYARNINSFTLTGCCNF